MMARYNAWANARLYRMAGTLPEEAYRRDVGAYFKSLHRTLNHLLTADRIWMRRLTGSGVQPQSLAEIVVEDFPSLELARMAEDARIIAFIDSLSEEDLERTLSYSTLNGLPQQHPTGQILAHVFNHQTHHRGQAHAILTSVGIVEPDPLDLLVMLRQSI